jgi:cellulose synthase/poly-beta-1,6-N-acetylglucosamine synthase-like glycosyltransferase
MKSLSVLIPIYNEERTIQELVLQLDGITPGVISECIFVNDGSSRRKMLEKPALYKVGLNFSQPHM